MNEDECVVTSKRYDINYLFEIPRIIDGVPGIREIWVEKNDQFDDPWVVMAAWLDDCSSGSFCVSTWLRKSDACAALRELYVNTTPSADTPEIDSGKL